MNSLETKVQELMDALAAQGLEVDAPKFGNWEDDWNDNGEFRNYRSSDRSELWKVVEHATRRGKNIEVTFRVQLGSVDQYPDAKDHAQLMKDREAIEAQLRRDAEDAKRKLDEDLETRIAELHSGADQ